MTVEIEEAYRHCTRVVNKEAKNFYYAFITLPSKKRRALYAAYAFSRICDDIADGEASIEAKVEGLNNTRERLKECYAGHPQGPVFTALLDASYAFDIPEEYFQGIIDGVEMDLTWSRYQNFDELRFYCYKVASVVGLICIQVFGYKNPEAQDYAIDLGLAMQLTNILRDVKEDADRGRIYIPLDEMEKFGYSEDELMNSVVNEPFEKLMAFQAQRVRRYFDSGLRLIPLLPFRSRACPAILVGIYSKLLNRIEGMNFMVFNGRISLSLREKLFIMAKLWMQSLIKQPPLLKRS